VVLCTGLLVERSPADPRTHTHTHPTLGLAPATSPLCVLCRHACYHCGWQADMRQVSWPGPFDNSFISYALCKAAVQLHARGCIVGGMHVSHSHSSRHHQCGVVVRTMSAREVTLMQRRGEPSPKNPKEGDKQPLTALCAHFPCCLCCSGSWHTTDT
jgi:hypothetical protein